MNKLLAIVVLIFLISGCEQMSRERNYTEKRAKTLQPAAIEDNAEILNQDEKERALTTEQPSFTEDKEQAVMKETDKEMDKAKDVGAILNEIEKIICEGDCSPYSMPKVDLSKLKGDINMALRYEGLNGISVDVNNQLEATLKGTVGCEDEKNKAFEIAERFKGVRQLKDMIFVVEIKEERL